MEGLLLDIVNRFLSGVLELCCFIFIFVVSCMFRFILGFVFFRILLKLGIVVVGGLVLEEVFYIGIGLELCLFWDWKVIVWIFLILLEFLLK